MPTRGPEVDRFREKLEREMRTGVVGLALLLAVDRAGPDYGYRLLKNLHEWSDGRLEVKEGTAYPILQGLERGGLLTSFWGDGDGGPPRKYYQTTTAGKEALRLALSDWSRLAAGVDAIRENAPKEAKR